MGCYIPEPNEFYNQITYVQYCNMQLKGSKDFEIRDFEEISKILLERHDIDYGRVNGLDSRFEINFDGNIFEKKEFFPVGYQSGLCMGWHGPEFPHKKIEPFPIRVLKNHVHIMKSFDDWFLIFISHGYPNQLGWNTNLLLSKYDTNNNDNCRFFKCDQIDGLIEFLKFTLKEI